MITRYILRTVISLISIITTIIYPLSSPPIQATSIFIGRIAVIRSGNVWIVGPDGSNPIMITDEGNYEEVYWSHDGTKLAFTRLGIDPSTSRSADEIGYYDLLTQAITIVVPPKKTPFLLLDNYYTFWNPRWSPDNKSIFFIASDGRAQGDHIHKVAISNGVWDIGFIEFICKGFDISSADGRIAYIDYSNYLVYGQNLNIASSSGTNHRAIIPFIDGQAIYGVAWTKNGKEILFSKKGDTPDQRLIATILPNGSYQKIWEAPDADRISVSPDGNFVTFSTGENVKVLDRNIGAIYPVSDGFSPSWSKGFPYLRGTVIDPIHGPLRNVTMELSNGLRVVTDVSGNYFFVDLPSGVYTLTPYKTGYSFDPPNASFTIHQTEKQINFVANPSELVNEIFNFASIEQQQIESCYNEAVISARDGDYFAYQEEVDKLKLGTEIVMGSVDLLSLNVSSINEIRQMTKLQMPGFIGKGYRYIDELRKNSGVVGHAFDSGLPYEVTSIQVRAAGKDLLNQGHRFFAAEFIDTASEQWIADKTVDRAILDSFNNKNALSLQYIPPLRSLSTKLTSHIDEMAYQTIDALSEEAVSQESIFVDDLIKRSTADIVTKSVLENRGRALHQAYWDRMSEDDQWLTLFTVKFLTRNLAGYFLDGFGLVISQLSFTAYDIYAGINRLKQDTQMALLGSNGVVAAENCVLGIYSNAIGGLAYIRDFSEDEQLPQVPAVDDVEIRNYSIPEAVAYGAIDLWERESFTEVQLHNPRPFETTYQIFAEYGVTGFLGMSYRSMVPEEQVITLQGFQSGSLRIYYKTTKGGVSPDPRSAIDLTILATTNTGRYRVAKTGITWDDLLNAGIELSTEQVRSLDAGPVLSYPLQQGYMYQPKTKDYLGWLRIENPLDETMIIEVQQRLPDGINVTNPNNGQLLEGQIIWSITLEPHKIVEEFFTFQAFGYLPEFVSMPPGEMNVHDVLDTKDALFLGEGQTIALKLPIYVECDPPGTTAPNIDVDVLCSFQNFGVDDQDATMNITLFDRDGNELSSVDNPLFISSGETVTTILSFITPLAEDTYVLQLTLRMQSGEETVYSSYLTVSTWRGFFPVVAKIDN